MSKILLLGAGRSVYSLAHYLKKYALELNLSFRVGDLLVSNAKEIADIVPNSSFFQFDVTSEKPLQEETNKADLVISMLPSHLHGKVAQSCLETSTHFITASYLSPQIEQYHEEVKKKGLHFIMECGLDPGIDHMSVMKLVDEIKENKSEIKSLKSYAGGLIAPSSNDNPWGYKFTWNPRNVVLAGQGIAMYKSNNSLKYVPYNSLFKRIETIEVPNLSSFEAYANRNSLRYIDLYALTNCPTVYRATLRNLGFCEAWDFLVSLGLTNDSFVIENSEGMTYRAFLDSFVKNDRELSLEEKIKNILAKGEKNDVFEKLLSLDLFSDAVIPLDYASPAQILQYILEQKWFLKSDDKDMVVMQHQIEYNQGNKKYCITSSCFLEGEDQKNTAMAKTVGLPLGIASRLLLQNKIKSKGVMIPTSKELYEPILKELEAYGINFTSEKETLD